MAIATFEDYDKVKNEMYCLLGKIVWKCAWIESQLRGIVAVSKGIIDPVQAAEKWAHCPARKLILEAAKLIKQSGDEDAIIDAEFIESLDDLFMERNSYVHGIHWTGQSWERLRITSKPPYHSEERITVERMEAFYADLEEADASLSFLRFRRGLLPDGFGFQNY